MRRAYTRRYRHSPQTSIRRNATRVVRRAVSAPPHSTLQSNPSQLMKYWSGVQHNLNSEDEAIFQRTANVSTYGYMTVSGFQTLLAQYCAHGGREPLRVFYDLGSGLGVPNVVAAALVPTLQKSVGVELSSQRVRESNTVLNNLRAEHPDIAARVHFINGDILSTQWSYGDADMIWISSLCFSPEFAAKVAERLNKELRKGTHVFTSKAIPELHHTHHNKFTAEMSWTSNSDVNHYIV